LGGISDFKTGCQPRTDIVKDEKGELDADSHSILDRWRNHFLQVLKVRVPGLMMLGRQNYTHKTEPVVPVPRAFVVELIVGKLKRHSHQILIKVQPS
jgi:hypothetical protein